MTAYLASWLPVLQSVLPRTSPETAPFPALDSPAPAPLGPIDLAKGTGKPTLVAFVRHCGCPFADKETKLLAEQSKKYKDLHVVIVQHSEQRESEEWFEKIGYVALTSSSYLLPPSKSGSGYPHRTMEILTKSTDQKHSFPPPPNTH